MVISPAHPLFSKYGYGEILKSHLPTWFKVSLARALVPIRASLISNIQRIPSRGLVVPVRDDINSIMSEYLRAKTNHETSIKVREIFKALTEELSNLRTLRRYSNLAVTFGTGIGQIANVPWVAIMDERITNTTMRGIYVVFLFRANMSGLYLTLNQGVGRTHARSPTRKDMHDLEKSAMELQQYFLSLGGHGFSLERNIDLSDIGATGKAYEKATIVHKFYDRENLPSNEEIEKDLGFIIDAYERFIGSARAKAKPHEKNANKIHKDQLKLAINLNNLAGRYYSLGLPKTALPLLEQAVKIRKDALGPNHLKVAASLHNLGTVYKALNMNAKALPLLQRAVDIREDALGPNHLKVAASLHNLGTVYKALGKHNEGLPLLERAVKIRKEASGQKRPKQSSQADINQLLQKTLEMEKVTKALWPALNPPSLDDKKSAYEMRRKVAIPPSQERIINIGFSSLSQAEVDLDKNTPLSPNASYYFTFDVGTLRSGNIEMTPEPLKMELLPNQARLKVALFAFKNEIEITPGRDVGEIQIMPDWKVKVVHQLEHPELSPANAHLLEERLFFLIHTPNKEGEFRLRCNMYCEQNLVQSRLITAWVSHTRPRSENPVVRSIVEYSMSKSLDPQLLANLKPKTLSIMLNNNGHGTHTFRVVGKDYKYEESFTVGTLQSLVREARKALSVTYWGTEEAWQPGLLCKYEGDLDLNSLKEDLVLLAKQGANFYLKLTQKVAPKGNKKELTDMMLKPATIEFVVKDPSEAANYMFPTALIYDYPLLTVLHANEYTLCPSFVDALKAKLPLEDTQCFKGECPSRHNPNLNVVCPSGFWGFRHSVGMPLGSASEGTQNIIYHESPEITVAAFPSFKTWPLHLHTLESMNGPLKWNIAETLSEAFKQFSMTKPHLVYFYCHGGFHKDTPYIQIGAKDDYEITPTSLGAYELRWDLPQPIVFINGCHTVGMDPKLLLDFASTFVTTLNASGVMGTEISIFEFLACAFAEEWLTRFLVEGETAGQATLKTRLKLLSKGNPLGLIYSLYANPDLMLTKENSPNK